MIEHGRGWVFYLEERRSTVSGLGLHHACPVVSASLTDDHNKTQTHFEGQYQYLFIYQHLRAVSTDSKTIYSF